MFFYGCYKDNYFSLFLHPTSKDAAMENPKKRNWKVLTSEYLARKPWFTVRHESIELPDGRRIPTTTSSNIPTG